MNYYDASTFPSIRYHKQGFSVTVQVAQNVPTIVQKKHKNVFSNCCRFFSACCDKKNLNERKQNLGIFEIHSKIGQLEN